ncbi:DUF3054 domain-containing protein [Leucobacter sp. G161]|uniref:DUF3054 domain-containing protein n=1 Tax=Leucobacter sp. G161 TaxID=663704 RepID=UPI00073C7430|nr:DUF3054 domain-containing protein [Leucobacter sp. G161]KUF08158.1 hypothetical protein AUL38_05340 [Leucobacter sp. G161]
MSATQTPTERASAGIAIGAFLLDAAFVVAFAALGRGSHDREATLAGLFETAWPFLAGLVIAWLVTLAWRRPVAVWRTGLPVWIGSAGLGLLLRALVGQGTALPFVIVATLTLCAMLVGWRLIAALMRVLSARRAR